MATMPLDSPEATLGPAMAILFTTIILIPLAGIVLLIWGITALTRRTRNVTRSQQQDTPR